MTEELLHAGRVERLPPGEGGIDIKRILSASTSRWRSRRQ